VFRGHHRHLIDAKGRTSVPAHFREILRQLGGTDAEQLVVTVNKDAYRCHCLAAYPVPEWRVLEDWIRRQNRFDDRVIALKRRFFSLASECSIDGLGRVLVPAYLREFAGLEKDVVWAGTVDHLELWSLARWESMAAEAESPENADLMRALGELGAPQ
jgi:MraZ protein